MRKSVIRKIGTVVSAITLIAMTSISVLAAQTDKVDIDRYSVDEEHLNVFVNPSVAGASIDDSNTTVMYGSEKLQIEAIKNFSDTNIPVTYKCIIDVSGSMDQARIDQAKEIISVLAKEKKDTDNITFSVMGNDLIKSAYFTDGAELMSKVDTIKVTHEDTNLYYAIVDEVRELTTYDEVNPKRCLIIFSDGADDQATGSTREEALKAIEDNHIPVFTIGLLKDKPKETEKESAKILGSFARESSGGKHYVPKLDEITSEDIAKDIVSTINSSKVIYTNIEDVDTSVKSHELKVSVKTNDGTLEDSIDIAESDIKTIRGIQETIAQPIIIEKIVEQPTAAPTAAPTPVPVEEPKTILGLNASLFWLIVAIAVVVLGVVIAIIIIMIKKKSKEEETEEEEEQPDQVSEDVDYGVTVGNSKNRAAVVNKAGNVSYSVTLTRMGKESEKAKDTFKFTVSGDYIIGRSPSKAALAFPEDTALSGAHCTLFIADRKLCIRDNGSTNGTFINGVPICGNMVVEKDDVLIIGSYEYRIFWE